MKKLMVLVCMVCMVFVLAGCKEEKDSLTYVLDKGTLVMGITDFPPMGYLEGGENVGFDIDVAKLVAEELGVTLVLQYIDWDSKVFELESKRIDVIWNGMTITEDRKLEMTFSKKYFDNELVILTLVDSDIESLADLAGKKVGVESSSSGQYAIQANTVVFNSLARLDQFTKMTEALMALQGGTVDAIVVDEIYARYYVLKTSDAFKICEATVGVEEYGIGFRLGDLSLRDEIDRIIDALAETGIIAEISEKWFGSNLFNRE